MSQQPFDPHPGETTQEFRSQPMPPTQPGVAPQQPMGQQPMGQQPMGQQPMWQPQRGSRPHFRVRSTFLTTEFWIFVVVSLGILIASAVDDGPGELGFSAGQAWKYITWLAIAYILSRGLNKLSGAPRDGGASGTEI